MRHCLIVILSALLAGLSISAAHAESVSLEGYFAADAREASQLTRISVARFDGPDGYAMANAIERALAERSVEGQRYFLVMANPNAADGVVTGGARASVDEYRDVQKREECVEKNGDKCIKKEMVEVNCRRRVIGLSADLRIARMRDGAIVYSDRKSRQDVARWCPNQNPPGRAEDVINGMVDSVANEVAGLMTPSISRYSLRFYESREGMPKEIGARFKAAVRQTQGQLTAACNAMADIDRDFPGHFALLYDLAICAEARGDYQGALAGYERAAAARPRDRTDFDAGITRTRRLIDGAADRALLAKRR